MLTSFILYVQPQLQVDSGKETATLLRVILYKMDNAAFGGDVPKVLNWTGPPRSITASYWFLIISFTLVLMSGVYTVLVKISLNVHSSTNLRELDPNLPPSELEAELKVINEGRRKLVQTGGYVLWLFAAQGFILFLFLIAFLLQSPN